MSPSIRLESLVPLILAADGSQKDRLAVIEDGISPLLGVRVDGWKYIRTPVSKDPEHGYIEVLYDLTRDAGETNDLSAAEPERLEELRSLGLESLIRNRGGRYLLVTGGDELSDYEIRLRFGAASPIADALYTALEPGRRGSEVLYSGRSKTRLLLLARLRSAGRDDLQIVLDAAPVATEHALEIHETVAPGAVLPTFSEGVLARSLARARPAIYLFEADRRGPEPESANLEGARLEALKALGYVD